MTSSSERQVIEGCRLPSDGPITDTERGWIEFLRIVYDDAVPAPTFQQVVLLRQIGRQSAGGG